MNTNYLKILCIKCKESNSFDTLCRDCNKCSKCCLCQGGCKKKSMDTTWTTTSFHVCPPDTRTTEERIKGNFQSTLELFGEEFDFPPETEWIEETPRRLYQMYAELLGGYKENPKEILAKTFEKGHDSLIALKNIDFVSLCEHHWVPFKGVVHFGYMPKNGKIIGLSKIPRLIHCFSHRLQTQEEMSSQIVDSFMEYVKPEGCMIITVAEHLCYSIRGPKTKGETVVNQVRGCFETNRDLKQEFIQMIGN